MQPISNASCAEKGRIAGLFSVPSPGSKMFAQRSSYTYLWSEASDDELEMLFKKDDKKELTGFGINLSTNIEQGNKRFEPPIDKFALPVGPSVGLQNPVRAVDFFLHFFDNKLIKEIV